MVSLKSEPTLPLLPFGTCWDSCPTGECRLPHLTCKALSAQGPAWPAPALLCWAPVSAAPPLTSHWLCHGSLPLPELSPLPGKPLPSAPVPSGGRDPAPPTGRLMNSSLLLQFWRLEVHGPSASKSGEGPLSSADFSLYPDVVKGLEINLGLFFFQSSLGQVFFHF